MAWMLTGSLAIAAGVAVAATAEPTSQHAGQPATQATAQPREFTLSEIIAFETERYRRLTIPITIRGEGPFRFMVDTGAEATVVSSALANQLQLNDRETATLVAMASERQVETTSVPQVSFGNREFSVASAAILESANIGGADGILGLDSLQGQRVLFDFENSQLAVADADELGGNRGFDIVVRARQRRGQLIVQRADIDGVTVAVIIDTGAQGSVGNMALQRRLRRARPDVDATMTDVNGVEITGNSKRARSLQMGRASITNFPIAFTDSPSFAALDLEDRPAMVLGMSELRLFKRVAIDFETRRVLLDMPDNARITDTNLFR